MDWGSLLPATLVLLGGIAVPGLLPRWTVGARAAWRVAAFLALTALVVGIVGSPLHPRIPDDGSVDRLWRQAIEVGWWVAAGRGVAGVIRLSLVARDRSREPKILSDVVCIVVYLVTALAIVDIVFAVPIGGLVATSGVIAVVIGLALQSTLSDVFSGLAVGVERPYRAGDVLWIEGGIEGRVQEVNWRSTHILTADGDVAVVPNSVVAKSRLVNHSLPVPVRRTSVDVTLDPRVEADRCRATLMAAALGCRLTKAPAPTVVQTGLSSDGATYAICLSVAADGDLAAARNELYGLVQRHLSFAAIPVAPAGVPLPPSASRPDPRDLLARSDLFAALEPAQIDEIARRMHVLQLSPGDVMFQERAHADALYVIGGGTVAITQADRDVTTTRHTLGPGCSVGLIGMLAETAYAATATALTAVEVFRIDRAALAAAIAAEPELRTGMEALARRAQSSLSADGLAEVDHLRARPDRIEAMVWQFLQRLDAPGAA